MIGQQDEQKWKQGSRQALRSNSPVKVGGYAVQFDPSVPQANREAFAQTPVRPTAQINRYNAQQNVTRVPVQQSSAPAQIAPPKTMGDMLRYNREMKAQRQSSAIEATNKQASIAAFNAQRQAEQGQMANRLAYDQLEASKAQNTAQNSLEAQKLANTMDIAKSSKAIEEAKLKSDQALNEARIAQLNEQTKSAEIARDQQQLPNRIQQDRNQAFMKYYNNPNDPEALRNWQAFNTPATMSPRDQAKLDLEALKHKTKFITDFIGASPGATKEQAEEAYRQLMGMENPDKPKPKPKPKPETIVGEDWLGSQL